MFHLPCFTFWDTNRFKSPQKRIDEQERHWPGGSYCWADPGQDWRGCWDPDWERGTVHVVCLQPPSCGIGLDRWRREQKCGKACHLGVETSSLFSRIGSLSSPYAIHRRACSRRAHLPGLNRPVPSNRREQSKTGRPVSRFSIITCLKISMRTRNNKLCQIPLLQTSQQVSCLIVS